MLGAKSTAPHVWTANVVSEVHSNGFPAAAIAIHVWYIKEGPVHEEDMMVESRVESEN